MISLETVRTLDDAYEIAQEIEFSELNYIFTCVVCDFMTDEDRKKIICGEIEEHQKKLMDFTENFGNRTWLKQIPIKSASPASSEK